MELVHKLNLDDDDDSVGLEGSDLSDPNEPHPLTGPLTPWEETNRNFVINRLPRGLGGQREYIVKLGALEAQTAYNNLESYESEKTKYHEFTNGALALPNLLQLSEFGLTYGIPKASIMTLMNELYDPPRWGVRQSDEEIIEVPREYKVLLNGMGEPRLAVIPSVVREPLKARVITLGNPAAYYITKPFQVAMWTYLRRYPQFVLIGEPLNTSHLDWLAKKSESIPLRGKRFWVSGDFDAATDNLKLNVSEECLRAFISRSKSKFNDVYRATLASNVILNMTGQELHDAFDQQTGQLMGSVSSFPVLCAVNGVCFWRALERYLEAVLAFKELPALINGDDIVFQSDLELYELWKEEIASVGFILSVGKNYCHPKILMVNCAPYYDAGPEKFPRFRPIPYLNCGLLLGRAKLAQAEGALTSEGRPIADIHNKVCSESMNPARTSKRFQHYWKNELKTASVGGKFNFFIDVALGGLGLQDFSNKKSYFTPFQRSFGSFLRRKLLVAREGREITKQSLMIGLYAPVEELQQNLKVFKYKKYRTLLPWPETTPLPQGAKKFVNITDELKNLAFHVKSSAPQIRWRHPSHQVMKEYLSRPDRLNYRDSKLRHFGFTFIEWPRNSVIDGVLVDNWPKTVHSVQELLNSSVLNKTPRDFTAPLDYEEGNPDFRGYRKMPTEFYDPSF